MQTNIVRNVALLILTVMCSRNLHAQDDSLKEQYMNIGDDSTHVPPVTTFTYRHGALYTVGMAGDSILSFSIDGKNIPRGEWSRYKDRIARTVRYVREARVRLAQDRRQLARDKEQLAMNRQQLAMDRQQADLERAQAEIEGAQAGKARGEADLERAQAGKVREEAEIERAQAGKAREEAERERRLAQLDMDRHLNIQKAQLSEQEQALREDRKIFQENLAGDLVKDGIVPDKDSIRSIELDPHHVSVNGKWLPAGLEKKYIEKYTGGGRSMSYHHNDDN